MLYLEATLMARLSSTETMQRLRRNASWAGPFQTAQCDGSRLLAWFPCPIERIEKLEKIRWRRSES
jgi:hypothetical protein